MLWFMPGSSIIVFLVLNTGDLILFNSARSKWAKFYNFIGIDLCCSTAPAARLTLQRTFLLVTAQQSAGLTPRYLGSRASY